MRFTAFASGGKYVSTANDAHNVANVVALNFANTANDAHTVVNAMGALCVNTANDAHNVANVVALRIANTANDAHNVVSVVEAKFAHMGNSAHNVANVVALRIASTCGLPARANYAHSVIYVVPWVTPSTVDVFADTTPLNRKARRARWTICVCAPENGTRTSHERSCIRTVACRRVKMRRISTKSYRARRGTYPRITSIVGTGSIHRCF